MSGATGRPADGWRTLALRDVCALASGAAVPAADLLPNGEGRPLIKPRDLAHRRIGEEKPAGVPDEAATTALARFALRPGDILLTRTGTIGRCALVTSDQEGWLFSDSLVRLRPHDPGQSSYLLHHLALGTTQDWIERHATRATIPSITLRALRELPVALPPDTVRREIGDALDALDEKVRVHEEISRTTAELRDVMAELLMRGELPPPALREF